MGDETNDGAGEVAEAGEVEELQAVLGAADLERADLSAQIETLNQRIQSTTEAYREALIEANPDIPVEMVQGETIEALTAAVEQGRSLVESVEQRLEAEAEVPGGSADRVDSMPAGLSGVAKIRHALSRNQA